MNITVTKNQVSINTDYILNDKEYNVNKCYFTFSDEYTDDLVKKAIFVQGTSTDLNNVPLIVKSSTYKDISSILNPVM